ncbi:hypothetical protein ABH935_010262 [Catenulispora sp. GAS73]|uniref:hypothetical protein n=1 Tax=Catenulispora sp. GAS73 TaxID=3156269 RepID=UPI0035180D53
MELKNRPAEGDPSLSRLRCPVELRVTCGFAAEDYLHHASGRDLLAAIDRLLDGDHQRSTGRLSVSQLSAEAGVKRWLLTHQHTDLKDLLQARVAGLDAARGDRARATSAFEKLKRDHRDLQDHCAELEERVRVYANALNLLMLENAALAGEVQNATQVPAPAQHSGAQSLRADVFNLPRTRDVSAPLRLPAQQRPSLSGAPTTSRSVVAKDVDGFDAVTLERGEHRSGQVRCGQRGHRDAVLAEPHAWTRA